MYLRCDNCGWSQDDFWSKGYNPLRSLLDWEDALLNKNIDITFLEDETSSSVVDKTYKEVIIEELARTAKKIKNMKWRTYEEFKTDHDANNAKCPYCGHKNSFITD